MESLQSSSRPDIVQVKLRVRGADSQPSDVYFHNDVWSACDNSDEGGVSGKLPPAYLKGVPRDVEVPGGMIALLEDQNKNRLQGPPFRTLCPKHAAAAYVAAMDESSDNGRRRSGSGNNAGTGTSNHVEIDVDMTLPQSSVEVPLDTDDALASSSGGGSAERARNGQKTNNKRCSGSSSVSSGTAQSTVLLGQHQHHDEEQQQEFANPYFPPSCEKDLEILKNVRKVYVQLTDDNMPCHYKVSDESQECLFETVLGDTNGSIWSSGLVRYFKQQQKVILVHDRNQRGVLKLEFGRSRTIFCCQTLRFAAMTAGFKLKPEEPLCIIFKDKECCVSCCCCPEATYETVPQVDSIHPFSVFTKGRWKNRAELMVKHSNGTILGFIDKEQNSYSLTMGENLKPAMKACLIGFLIAMDVMDRQDAGKLSCYLRPTTILLITLLLMLCITIGGYLLHHFSFMFLSKEDSVLCGGTFDEAGSRRTAPIPHFNNDRTSETSSGDAEGLSAVSSLMNASTEFHFPSSSLSNGGAGEHNSSWPV